jgi:hypothetical protein
VTVEVDLTQISEDVGLVVLLDAAATVMSAQRQIMRAERYVRPDPVNGAHYAVGYLGQMIAGAISGPITVEQSAELLLEAAGAILLDAGRDAA